MPEHTPSWRARLTSSRSLERARPTRREAPTTARVVNRQTARTTPDEAVPWSVRLTAAWAWRLLVAAAAVVVIGYLAVTFKIIVVSVLVALLLAVLLEPVARRLRRTLRFPRALASLTALLLMLAAVTGLLVLAGRSIADGFGALAEQAVAGFEELTTWLSDGPLAVEETQIDGWLGQITGQLQANSSTLVSGVVNVTGSVTSVLTGAVISLFCLFFFLKDGRSIWQWVVRLFPAAGREAVNEAGIRGWVTIGSYTRTQILVAFVDAVGISVGAAILGVPLALPIGVLVFLGAFIPIVGALLSGAVAVLVALVDQGVGTALIMLGIVLLVQQIEGNLLQPWLQSNALALHPIAILLAVTAGTGVAGVLGALLAVPVAAVVNTVVLYLHGHDKYPYLAHDPDRPGGPPGAVTEAIEETWAHFGEDAEEAEADDGAHPAGSGTDRDARPRGDRGVGGTAGPATAHGDRSPRPGPHPGPDRAER